MRTGFPNFKLIKTKWQLIMKHMKDKMSFLLSVKVWKLYFFVETYPWLHEMERGKKLESSLSTYQLMSTEDCVNILKMKLQSTLWSLISIDTVFPIKVKNAIFLKK